MVTEPYYSQRMRSVYISLSAFFILCDFVQQSQFYFTDPVSRKTVASTVKCVLFVLIFTLHAKLSGTVYCNQSCLFVWVCVCVGLLP